MTINFVTTNKGKAQNAQAALRRYGITVKQVRLEMTESRSEDPALIALEKARQAYKHFGNPVIVEDSGFFIDELNGFPMTHIKFGLNTIGIDGILKLLRGHKNRGAEWRMTLAYAWGPRKNMTKSFTFIERGYLSKAIRPVKRTIMSDLWRIFVPTMIPGNKKALSELSTSSLQSWVDYYDINNQFAMFGKWIVSQKK